MRVIPWALAALAAGQFSSAVAADGVVSWQLLEQVQLVRDKARYVPKFADAVSKLHDTEVRVQGFMIPLGTGAKQERFILSANPSDCGFCMPGGPESLVEVQAKTPLKYTLDPVVLKGRFNVLKDDASGVFYRLVEAVPAAAK